MTNPRNDDVALSGVARAVDQTLAWTLVVLMAVSVANVLWQVFTRFALASPSSFTEEFARYLLIWIGLLGASYAAGKQMHLAIDLAPTVLTGRARRRLRLFIQLSVFAFALFVMVVGGTRLVTLTFLLGQTSAALRIPLGYVYLALPLSGVLIMWYAIQNIVSPRDVERVRRAGTVENSQRELS